MYQGDIKELDLGRYIDVPLKLQSLKSSFSKAQCQNDIKQFAQGHIFVM